MLPDHYSALGITPDAEPEMVNAAGRILNKKFIDDEEKRKEINIAFNVLKNAESRAEYDRQRKLEQGLQISHQDEERITVAEEEMIATNRNRYKTLLTGQRIRQFGQRRWPTNWTARLEQAISYLDQDDVGPANEILDWFIEESHG